MTPDPQHRPRPETDQENGSQHHEDYERIADERIADGISDGSAGEDGV